MMTDKDKLIFSGLMFFTFMVFMIAMIVLMENDNACDRKAARRIEVEQEKYDFIKTGVDIPPHKDTLTISHKVTVQVGNDTITANVKYDDGSELTEEDKIMVRRMLESMLGEQHSHAKKKDVYYAGGYGEVEDINHLGGSCGFYMSSCCGRVYACPNVERSCRGGDDGTVYGRSGFSNTVNPSMKMGGTASSLSSYPSVSF